MEIILIIRKQILNRGRRQRKTMRLVSLVFLAVIFSFVFPGCWQMLNLRVQNNFAFPVSVIEVSTKDVRIPVGSAGTTVAANSVHTFSDLSGREQYYHFVFQDAKGRQVAEVKATRNEVQRTLVDYTYTISIGPPPAKPASPFLAVKSPSFSMQKQGIAAATR